MGLRPPPLDEISASNQPTIIQRFRLRSYGFTNDDEYSLVMVSRKGADRGHLTLALLHLVVISPLRVAIWRCRFSTYLLCDGLLQLTDFGNLYNGIPGAVALTWICNYLLSYVNS